jgi:hypothetical protein
VRLVVPVAVLVAAVLACSSLAATATTYGITFSGSATEHQVNLLQNIQDSGVCDSAEHIDVTATMVWTASWKRFNMAKRSAAPNPARTDGSAIQGSIVKDACGLDLSLAPPGWIGQTSCSSALAVAAAPQLTEVKKTATALVLAIAAPSFAVPVGVGCSLNVRNDQLATHAVVSLKKLAGLKKGASLTVAVGTARPGAGDVYAPSLDCSQPTKPYEGYRTADRCQDDLSWSGTVKITRS